MRNLITIIFLFLICKPSYSDEYVSPRIQRIYSQNGLYCLVIAPTNTPKGYEKEVEKRKVNPEKYKNKPLKDSITPCKATLYKVSLREDGLNDEVIWTTNLVNKISPNTAMVTNDGEFVITFDEWWHTGYGDNVMVVYGKNGKLLKKYKLGEIAPPKTIEFLKTESSTIWYQGVETYSENPARICILMKDINLKIERRKYNLTELKFEE